jgi:hypothetical protein
LANESTEDKLKRLINILKMSLSTASQSIPNALDSLQQLGDVEVTAAILSAAAEHLDAVKRVRVCVRASVRADAEFAPLLRLQTVSHTARTPLLLSVPQVSR